MLATRIARFLDLLAKEIPPDDPAGHHLGSKDGHLTVYISTNLQWHSMQLDNEDLDLPPETLVGDIRALLAMSDDA